ncbi:protein unc-93 homolog A-like [Centruroides sculpturatus]|uniref:protein unc-93 homolog A-like n=1 Tax=Centruroides sculpturatus TaxID=218467 RepID=UPI000C6EE71E|nr:protein unc-93 homolog A-like [Centruroides sculpturatus]XP_023214109.1 protein unc-93 homolog A-like [Centruroides sculpturatus]XP_023214110.1 protein unc-93 homolog A-like [Centruroides sculpturatus]XP_023228422.1 protein unc-93 homolog A-like [Centruroides sculpturatus]XP_023228423.1 protein unc-93 homolog A-like [Centruroides sculpturatus]XP_023228424.1 protein unc-93 homolog A-like [Centruroides sculpturatus]
MAELQRISHIAEDQAAPVGIVNIAFKHDEPSKESSPPIINEKPVQLSKEEKRQKKLSIFKNLLVLSFGFLLLFTAFQSLSNLQSSINSAKGLGTASLSVIYGALVLSCMFLPTFMIKLLTLKYTLIVSMLMYSSYMAANFYPDWGTLIPTSIILGLGGAPLWTSKCSYLTHISIEYAQLTGNKVETIVTRFFGIFFMVFQSGQVWGNLIAYKVLQPGNVSSINESLISGCGANFCVAESSTNNTNLERPSDFKIYLLCGIYTGCSLLAALFIFIFLDPLKKSEDGKGKPSYGLLIETMRHLKNPHQVLLVPLTIFSGLEQAYIIGDFTQAFVSCSWGIHNVGYVMICFGVMDALGSVTLGHLSKITGRKIIFIATALSNVGIIILMFLWSPNPDQKVVFFVISGFWGLGDAVWQTQINSLYGVLFPKNEEAAFANYRLWESLGFIIAFAYSSSLCITIKLYILLIVLVVGMMGYLTIEIRISTVKKNEISSETKMHSSEK